MKTYKPVALITGITGQDGSYLAELLLSKNYEVHGMIRRSSSMCNRKWIDGLDLQLHYGDMTDANSIDRIINKIAPDEIYNLAAQSHVGISFENPEYTFKANALGVIHLLESVRKYAFEPKIKIYQASTSEMLAQPPLKPLYFKNGVISKPSNEQTPFKVHSPYAASKLLAHNICHIYRECYDMFICCGILFNHESPRRGDNFVTQKIVKNLVNGTDFELGNIESYRDWGYAKEYVEAMWLMLQQDEPDDYVIATGESHTVGSFLSTCCEKLGYVPLGLLNGDINIFNGEKLHCQVKFTKQQKRPWDVDYLCGDASKAERVLGWKPKVKMKELIEIMIKEEMGND
jgi:GDPmannose 4,6-dehydratase